MSNKFIIQLILIISLTIIGVVLLVQFNKSPQKLAINLNISSQIASSLNPQIVSSSSLVQDQTSISSSQVIEENKSINSDGSRQAVSNFDIDRVDYLPYDRSKLSKSVIQFLECTTKYIVNYNEDFTFQNDSSKRQYGAFIFEDGEEVYKCPPKIETLGCKFNVSYLRVPSKPYPITYDENNQPIYPEDFNIKDYISKLKTGWTCDLMYPVGIHSDGGFTCILTQNNDYNFQYTSRHNENAYLSEESFNALPDVIKKGPSCYAIPKTLL